MSSIAKKNTDFPKLPFQDNFLLSLHNNNYSVQTVINYARDLSIFALFLQNRSIFFEKLSKQDIDVYKGYLRNCEHLEELGKMRKKLAETALIGTTSSDAPNLDDKKQAIPEDILKQIYKKVYTGRDSKATSFETHELDARSINRMLSAIRSYLRYLIDMDKEFPLAPDSIKLVKAIKKKKQLAEFDELVKLIEFPTAYEEDKRVGIRNRAMLEMLFASGMRISELMSLTLGDINVAGKLFITGKGKKQRFVYLTPRSLRWLDLYLVVRFKWELSTKVAKSAFFNEDIKDNRKDYEESDGKLIKVFDEKGGVNGENIEADDSFDRNADDKKTNNRETYEFETNGLKKVLYDKSKNRETYRGDIVKHRKAICFLEKNISSLPEIYDGIDLNMVKLVEEMRKADYIEGLFSPALFVPFSGRASSDAFCRLSTNYFQEKIAEYRRRVGILVPTSAHSLRHGFATYLAEKGASVVSLQVLLGHESLNTTTRYVHGSDKLAEKEHHDKHPLG